jgi:hypothetical protein
MRKRSNSQHESDTKRPDTQPRPTLGAIELLQIVSLRRASQLSGLSTRTLRERHRDRLVRRGENLGMRLGDALQLLEPAATDAA